jgi:hypothetical protein
MNKLIDREKDEVSIGTASELGHIKLYCQLAGSI